MAVERQTHQHDAGSERHYREIISNTDQGEQVRAEAIAGLDAQTAENGPLLWELVTSSSGALAEEALRVLLTHPLAPAQLEQLRARSPLNSPHWQQMLDLRTAHPNAAATGEPAVAIDARMAARIGALAAGPSGDVTLGERLFFHPRVASCYRCHEFGSRGAEVGPNLTGIDRTADRRRLAESLLDPNREIAPQFVPWVLELHDGRILTGVPIGQDDQNRQSFLDATGERITVEPGDVANRHQQRISIMPSGLADQLTDHELASLLEFLAVGSR